LAALPPPALQARPRARMAQWNDAVQDYAFANPRYNKAASADPPPNPAECPAFHCIPRVDPFSTGVLRRTEGANRCIGERPPLYVAHAVAQCAVRNSISPGRDIRCEWNIGPDVSANGQSDLPAGDDVNRGGLSNAGRGRFIYNLARDGQQPWPSRAELSRGAVEYADRRPRANRRRPRPLQPTWWSKDRVIVGPAAAVSFGEIKPDGSKGLDPQERGETRFPGPGPQLSVRNASGTCWVPPRRYLQAAVRQAVPDSGCAQFLANDKLADRRRLPPVWGKSDGSYRSPPKPLDLVYYGTGNRAPYTPSHGLGSNQWRCHQRAGANRGTELLCLGPVSFPPPHDNWTTYGTPARPRMILPNP